MYPAHGQLYTVLTGKIATIFITHIRKKKKISTSDKKKICLHTVLNIFK